jgi:cation:H+ antiporter
MFEILTTIIIFLVSLFFLIKSSNFFIESAEKIGLYFNLPYFFIGTIIIGLGTSLPELVTSIIATLKGYYDVALANVIGSNISNILLIVGFSAVFTTLLIKKKLIKSEIPFLLLSSLLPLLFIYNGKITFIEGLFFIFAFVIYLIYTLKQEKEEFKEKPKINLLKEFFILVLALIVLIVSSDYVVNSLINLSKLLKINLDVITATLLALGTSLPELMVSISILKNKKSHDLIIGNVIGSNIMNVFLILGLSSLIHTLTASSTLVLYSLFLFMITLVFSFIILDNRVEKEEGVILILLYVLFIIFSFQPNLF